MSEVCSTCGKPIVWMRTKKTRKPIPLDPEQVLGGNIVIEDGLARVLGRDPERVAFVSHFFTCPNAAHHRKAKL